MRVSIRSCRWFSTIVVSASLMSAASLGFADVTGKVTLDGKAPDMKTIDMSAVSACASQHPDPVTEETVVVGDKGELKNVVVSVKKEEGQDLPGDVPKEDAVIDQKGCMYSPHVTVMMVGQPLKVKNSDPTLHNVHSLSTINGSFNKGQPNVNDGELMDPQPKAPEVFRIKCDVHSWMGGWVCVFDHPYFSVTGDDGTFDIKNLPDGDYTIQAWQEKYGTQESKVTVKDGKATVNFTFKAEGASATPAAQTAVAQSK
jgi:hypothetical protein